MGSSVAAVGRVLILFILGTTSYISIYTYYTSTTVTLSKSCLSHSKARLSSIIDVPVAVIAIFHTMGPCR